MIACGNSATFWAEKEIDQMAKTNYALKHRGLWLHHYNGAPDGDYEVDLSYHTHLKAHMCNSKYNTEYGLRRAIEEGCSRVKIFKVSVSRGKVEVIEEISQSAFLSETKEPEETKILKGIFGLQNPDTKKIDAWLAKNDGNWEVTDQENQAYKFVGNDLQELSGTKLANVTQKYKDHKIIWHKLP